MNIYEYNSSTINEYLTEDCGLLSSSVRDIFDYGNISEIVKETQDFYIVTCSETLYPFGTITIKRNTKSKFKKVSSGFIRLENLNKKSIIFYGIILTWYGYGTVFELCNGLERQVIPDVSGGGVDR
jgi:hypothetical protein